ncbi:MAG: molybdopterin-dependent oxidoreductase [candidate division KSB1 bacterium]|nr:molybdopterin-dependent oxidoreductase [candidate division KSB1 bacterium]MDZ7274222.1 molybdopterin-dependent oxidoreductase [candidate division KSB1 bacterium]MDZ7287256.1 molybdopterin-dependent oxidoreductase [candidate division KSB1 bacterium]MDZ7296820.1 molybdopterin-dependent oxidoreductase [candidate division KSB1 bacterium]MDZ7347686.1 molybdopterin-dependent oxidoreductase [candidate division KSB1 bacterium]
MSDQNFKDFGTMNRRAFLRWLGVGAGTTVLNMGLPLNLLATADPEQNPLAGQIDRNWEKIYRDQYKYDSWFDWVCSPNDTHACRVRAYVRNGIVTRLGATYDYQNYSDIYGNHATNNWNPRQCAKGYTFHRVIYGPYRLKHPIVRKGWKAWADAGFPALTPELKSKYKFDSRGDDEFVQISWEDAFDNIAKALVAISTRYSGEEGKKRLLSQGYQPEMVEATQGAGTRCVKMRGGMGLLGVLGKYGMYRLNNSLALLDAKIRGVGPDKALAGRNWSNYTWHGDQAPGHPWVHGLQTSDCDFNDLRFSKLIIMDGKNLVENKLTDSHWFIECMERGAKIVVIAPEYGPPSTKADYWIPIRPATDAALWLGVTKIMVDNKWYDEKFIKQFTDLPLLVRKDNLKRLRAAEVFPNYQSDLKPDGPSMKIQGFTKEQHDKLGDYVVWDAKTNKAVAVTRDDVGETLERKGIDPVLDGTFKIKLVDGKEVEVATLWTLYQVHLKDYVLDTVAEITQAPKNLIAQLAQDMATMKPVAIHQGEGINHWFHATEMNRAAYLPLMLTGNIGKPGAGCHTWAGNYKAALFQGSPWTGPGFKGWVAEDPFEPNLDPNAPGKAVKTHAYTKDEEPAYWNHGDKALIVETPKYGRKNFTGNSHMPTPTKALIFNNVNLINNAKWAYEMIKNVNPNIEMIVSLDIQMTASIEYADLALPANSWLEFEDLEVTASCSNPFLQIWKGGIPPVFDSKDDLTILAGIAKSLAKVTGEKRFEDYFKFEYEGKRSVYLQRLLDTSTTTAGYKLADIMAGKYGPPGGALMLFRTYPRIPFFEQIKYSEPFLTDTGRLHAYADIPEAIEYGENFIVHREGPEATPYLPNVIVSSNPFIRPDDYGIPLTAQHWDERTIRNVKMPWSQVKTTKNFLWEKGFQFYCLTPKTRHRVHSSWSNVDWHMLYDSNFGDPYRLDKRAPSVGEHQLHINPQAARDLGINDGDYVYVDANPADRPYIGAKPDEFFYRVSRCMLRVKYNHAYPYNIVMMKHAPFIATEKSVRAHETRPDGRALSENTGYQSNLRYGSQQSITRNWHMPMHQTDSLFHKAKATMGFIFGGEADNHALNTVPKETLVRVTKAEDGGMNGIGVWFPATTGFTPDNESEFMEKYIAGELVAISE